MSDVSAFELILGSLNSNLKFLMTFCPFLGNLNLPVNGTEAPSKVSKISLKKRLLHF
jgi:hypothetical protein